MHPGSLKLLLCNSKDTTETTVILPKGSCRYFTSKQTELNEFGAYATDLDSNFKQIFNWRKFYLKKTDYLVFLL